MHLSPDDAVVAFAELSLVLLPSGAVFNNAHQVMFVADVHLGKAATYRQLGQPVPQGTTTQTLNQLSADIKRYKPNHLIVLGDFLHGPLIRRSRATLDAIAQWRAAHKSLQITLIRGNHDAAAGDPPSEFEIELVDEPFKYASVSCCHEAQRSDLQPTEFMMCGHIHPVAVLHGRARERLRLACFVLGPKRLVLPAYGAFTGGHVYKPAPDETIYVVADQQVFKLPGSRSVSCQP